MKYMKMFELMGEINDKFFDENYDPPQRASYSVRITQKRGVKRWIIPAAVGVAACLAVAIAAPRIVDALNDRNAIIDPVTSGGSASIADKATLRDWFTLPHNAINSADKNVMFSADAIEDDHAVLTFESDVANDIYAVDGCKVKCTGYANAPYLGKVVLVQFDNGLWGLYRNSYKCDDYIDTEISVKAGDTLKAGDRIGTMYPDDFKLLISVTKPSAELFTPAYPELDKWERGHSTLPVAYHNPWSEEDPAPEYLTENLGYRSWHSRFYFIHENEPAYAVADGTVYAINERTYPDGSISENEREKTVVIELDTDFDTPLYAIYTCVGGDNLNIEVGDTVKEGDVIGTAFYNNMAAPVGMTLTISTTPYVPEVDEDGNISQPSDDTLLGDWLAQPHNSINIRKNNVILTPTEQSDDKAIFTIPDNGVMSVTDIYAVDDCTVTYAGYANAPYLGNVVIVDFENGLWGLYRNSYKNDELDNVKFSVKAGDELKAGEFIGTAYPDGFELVITENKFPNYVTTLKYPELAKWAYQISETAAIDQGGITRKRDENIGYNAWYEETFIVDRSVPAQAVANGKVIEIGGSLYGGSYAVIEHDTLAGTLYARYDGLVTDSLTVKVGDTVKRGDALGDAFTSPDGGPVLFKLRVSVLSDTTAELDDDGNAIQQGQVIVD